MYFPQRNLHAGWIAAGVLTGCASSTSLGGGVGLDQLSGEVRLEAEHRDEAFRGTTDSTTRENVFRENLKLDFDAHVYHPRLVTLGGVLDLGLEQRETVRGGSAVTSRSNNDNTRYDLSSTLLKDLPYSARLFAQRSQIRVRQSFFPTNEAIVNRFGTALSAKEWIIPTHLELARYSFKGTSGDLRREHRDSANLSGSTNSEALRVHYKVDWQDVNSELSGGDYEDLQAFGGVSWQFGRDLAHSISIDGQQREQTGDIATENSAVSGRARFGLTDDLESLTGVSVHRSELGGIADSRTERADLFTGLTHQLFESLTTNVRGSYIDQEFGNGDLQRSGVDGRVDYRKRIPIGKLSLGYKAARSEQTENSGFGALVTVQDESHVVVAGVPIILDNPNVEPVGTIVTDATSTIVYAIPADYTVEQIGVFTRIVIPVGSRILPGQTILISYLYRPSVRREFTTRSQSANFDVSIGEVASLGAYWMDVDQDLVSGVDTGTLDQSEEIGAHLQLSEFSQRVGYEYVRRESLLTPLRRSRLTWDTWFEPASRLGVNAIASWYETHFPDEGITERGLSAIASVDWRPQGAMLVQVRGEYRRSDIRSDKGTGVFLRGRFNYDYRETSISLDVLASEEDWDVASDREILRAMLTIRRRF